MFKVRSLPVIAGAVIVFLATLLMSGCSQKETGILGSENNPIKMSIVPSLETGRITTAGNKLAKELEKHTGYKFTVNVPVSYAAVIEAIGSGRVDIAWLPPLSYVLAHDKYGANVMLITERDGYTDYFGLILTRKDSGITKLSELKGKKFAFVDALSTSGTLYPKQLLVENGINPDKDLQALFAGGHDKAIIALYNKQVDACSCYGGHKQDARDRVKTAIPDIMEKTVVLGKTATIPNDNVCVRKDFPADMAEKIKKALLEIASSEDGKKLLEETAQIDGLQEVEDSAYDSVRKMVSSIGINLEKTVTEDKPKAPAKPKS